MLLRIILFTLCLTGIYPDNYTFSGAQKTGADFAGVTLTIENIRNKTGLIRIGVFTSESGYPDKPVYSLSLAKDTIENGRIRVRVPLDKPCYASFSVLDDENSNGLMDYRLGIIPREGFGFSNNPKITSRKAPPFAATSFRYSQGVIGMKIIMEYI